MIFFQSSFPGYGVGTLELQVLLYYLDLKSSIPSFSKKEYNCKTTNLTDNISLLGYFNPYQILKVCPLQRWISYTFIENQKDPPEQLSLPGVGKETLAWWGWNAACAAQKISPRTVLGPVRLHDAVGSTRSFAVLLSLGLTVRFKPGLSSFHLAKLLLSVDTLCIFASVNGLFLLHRED